MFGRKKGDEYDEYNERQNAKYDDDYISDTEEYRYECTHSHEQTYEDYDVREECGHSHEQTYDDFNSEQKPYDELNEVERKFEKYLEDGEYILWCGAAVKDAKPNETGVGCAPGAARAILIAAILTIWLCTCLSIIAIIAIISMWKKIDFRGREYAITNRRILELNGNNLNSVPLNCVRVIENKSSERNIGYILYQRTDQPPKGAMYPASGGILAVREPEIVCNILKNAIDGARKKV